MKKKDTVRREEPGEEEFQRNVYALQSQRFEIVKDQDLENGRFDVTFEIEGKYLHAHQFVITSVSQTLDSWITDRWSTKDAPIKVESYSYNNFFEFIRFIYIGSCELSSENIYDMVDMAEFYAVECLKIFCDKFLSKMDKSVEAIEEMYEFAIKYSLKKFEFSIKEFIFENFDQICKSEKFNDFKKGFVEFLSMIKRHDGSMIIAFADRKKEGNFFKAVYKWAENRVLQEKTTDDGCNCKLHEGIELEFRTVLELKTILPRIEFSKMNFDVLENFVVEKGFILSPSQLAKSFSYFRKHYDSAEKLFKAIYEVAEKQAFEKMFSNPDNFNLAEIIKADMAQIIPRVKFYKMEKEFLMNFVVAKGLLTEEQISHIWDTRVQIRNGQQLIFAAFKDNIGIRRAIQKREKERYETKQRSSNKKLRFTLLKFSIPSAPSTVLKMVGVEWYLCLEKDGVLTFKHESIIDRNDYLIAEMECSNNTPFILKTDCNSCLTAGYRNI